MADYDLKSITPKASVAADTEFLFGAADQSTGTPVPYAFSIIKTWVKSWVAKGDVGLGNVTNNAQLTIANNLSDLNSAATARKNIWIGNAIHPGYKAGNWYVPVGMMGVSSTGNTQTAGTIYLTPFYMPQKATLSDLAVNLITAQAASNCQLAIYNANGSDPTRAGTLVGATGSIATTTTGNKSATFSGAATFQLDIGWYWFAMNGDTTGLATGAASVQAYTMAQVLGSATLANLAGSGTNSAQFSLTVSQTFGTWPDLTGATYTEGSQSNRGPAPIFKVTSVP